MKGCVSCGRSAEVLSWRGFCNDCVALRVIEAITQIREKKGPVYERWAAKLGIRKSPPRYIQTTLCFPGSPSSPNSVLGIESCPQVKKSAYRVGEIYGLEVL